MITELKEEDRRELVMHLLNSKSDWAHLHFDECLHFLKPGCTLGDAMAVSFYLNEGMVLCNQKQSFDIADIAKEIAEWQ